MLDSKKFYGVHIPKDSNFDKPHDGNKLHVYRNYEQMAIVVKEYKNARFKIFSSENEARYFAIHGSVGGQGNPNVITESIPFKSLKRPEIYKFRKLIENDDYTSVKFMIWENPRYLIGIGDTPTIMQEGPRYNALHIIAKHNRVRLAELILSTVSNPDYTKLLYGAAGENSYIVRPEVLVDLYLNTPDKALNETPLHFAAKYGAVDVISVFIQYPQLNINVKNKYNQTPKDITCKQVLGENAKLASKIHKMLNELFYVPIWRSPDDAIQPIIGKPYSPKSPPVCPGVTSPISPSMEINAIAGPMTLEEATEFLKTWKSPVRNANSSSPSTPHVSQGVLLRNPLEIDRGLEKVGRSLATKFHVSWKEYWPFLNKFIDLRSEEGLRMLEEYLSQRFIQIRTQPKVNESSEFGDCQFRNNSSQTPISELCSAFAKCTISSPSHSSVEKSAGDIANAPYLLIESICVMFADNILEMFARNFTANMPIEDNVVVLIKKIRNLIVSLNGCKRDSIFKTFPLNKVHPRIALWMGRKLLKFNERRLSYATSTFKLVDQTETNVMVKRISLSPSSCNTELEQIVQTLKCINNQVIKLLKGVVAPLENPKDELTCRKEWSEIESCSCYNNDSILSKLRRLGQEVSKKIMFTDEDDISNNVESRKPQVTNSLGCDNEPKKSTEKICDNLPESEDEDDDYDDLFFTPPSSLSETDNEMDLPEEGPEVFIYDNKGTSMDNAVLEAIADVVINPDKYPMIYRWKHSILLHSTIDRFSWPTPNIRKKNVLC